MVLAMLSRLACLTCITRASGSTITHAFGIVGMTSSEGVVMITTIICAIICAITIAIATQKLDSIGCQLHLGI